MPISVQDSEWDRFGWRVPWLPKESQPDRKPALRKGQAHRLPPECNPRSSLGGHEALKLVTSIEPAEARTNG